MTERSDFDLAAALNSDNQLQAWSKIIFIGITRGSGRLEGA